MDDDTRAISAGDNGDDTVIEADANNSIDAVIEESEIVNTSPEKTNAELFKNAAVWTMCISAGLLIIGMTMWLVPWATIGFAAGFITVGGVFIMLSGALSYRSTNAKLKAKKGIAARKDGRAKNARNSAFALVGKVALMASLVAVVALMAKGLVSTDVYIFTMLGTLALYAIWALAEMYYINKL